jgi:hypothetical protein
MKSIEVCGLPKRTTSVCCATSEGRRGIIASTELTSI